MTYEERRLHNRIVWGGLLIIIIVVCVVWNRMHTGKRRAIAGIGAPIQKEAEGLIKPDIEGYDTTITFLYSYEIEALVLSSKEYTDFNFGGKLASRDLGLAWGKVAEYNTKVDFHWRQANRWLTWRLNSQEELDFFGGYSGITQNVSNNHAIALDPEIRKQINRIKKGDHIRLKGYLVNVDTVRADGATINWHSSVTREDEGDGACEVIYVTSVEKLP